jgi:hypothetical protein
MGNKPVKLMASIPGDLSCPYCAGEMDWDINQLYSFTFEYIKCPHCNRTFYARQRVTTTYDVTMFIKRNHES